MRVLNLVDDGNVVELDVEVLVDALERAADLDVVLELDGDRRINERLEEAEVGSVCWSATVSHSHGRSHPRLILDLILELIELT